MTRLTARSSEVGNLHIELIIDYTPNYRSGGYSYTYELWLNALQIEGNPNRPYNVSSREIIGISAGKDFTRKVSGTNAYNISEKGVDRQINGRPYYCQKVLEGSSFYTNDMVSASGGKFLVKAIFMPELPARYNYGSRYNAVIDESIGSYNPSISLMGIHESSHPTSSTTTELVLGRTYYLKTGMFKSNLKVDISTNINSKNVDLVSKYTVSEDHFYVMIPFTLPVSKFSNFSGNSVSIFLFTYTGSQITGTEHKDVTIVRPDDLKTSSSYSVSGYNRDLYNSFFLGSELYSTFKLRINKTGGDYSIRGVHVRKHLNNAVVGEESFSTTDINVEIPYFSGNKATFRLSYRVLNSYGIYSDWEFTGVYLVYNYDFPTITWDVRRLISGERNTLGLKYDVNYKPINITEINRATKKNRVNISLKIRKTSSDNDYDYEQVNLRYNDADPSGRITTGRSFIDTGVHLSAGESYEAILSFSDSISTSEIIRKVVPGAFVHMDFGPNGVAIGKDHNGVIPGVSGAAVFEVQGNMNLTNGDYYKDGKSLDDIINDKINENNFSLPPEEDQSGLKTKELRLPVDLNNITEEGIYLSRVLDDINGITNKPDGTNIYNVSPIDAEAIVKLEVFKNTNSMITQKFEIFNARDNLSKSFYRYGKPPETSSNYREGMGEPDNSTSTSWKWKNWRSFKLEVDGISSVTDYESYGDEEEVRGHYGLQSNNTKIYTGKTKVAKHTYDSDNYRPSDYLRLKNKYFKSKYGNLYFARIDVNFSVAFNKVPKIFLSGFFGGYSSSEKNFNENKAAFAPLGYSFNFISKTGFSAGIIVDLRPSGSNREYGISLMEIDWLAIG